jgi:hypothetical protein
MKTLRVLWLVNFIWASFGNAGCLFYNPHRKYDFVSFLCKKKNLEILLKAFQILDLNIGLLEIWNFSPKCRYLGDAFKMLVTWRCRRDTCTVLVTWRWKQWLCSRCWYPEDRGSKVFQNAVHLVMQTEDSSKLLVPWRWRQWVPPKCCYLEDAHHMFLHNFSTFKMHTAVTPKVLVRCR